MSTSQFDLDFSGRLPVTAQLGMEQADANAAEDWKHWFDACVMAAAKKKPEITSDDVLAELEALPCPPGTHNLAAIGPAMIRAAKMGILRGTDRVKRSERPEKHGNRQNVWESKVFVAGGFTVGQQVERTGCSVIAADKSVEYPATESSRR